MGSSPRQAQALARLASSVLTRVEGALLLESWIHAGP